MKRIIYIATALSVFGILWFSAGAHGATYTWTGGSTTPLWTSATNWAEGAPAWDTQTDLVWHAEEAARLGSTENALGSDATIRSLTFNANVTSAVSLRLTSTSGGTPTRNLAFEADTGPASINVNSGATGDITIGIRQNDTLGADYSMTWVSDVIIDHQGSGLLTFDQPIDGAGKMILTGGGTLRTGAGNSSKSEYTGNIEVRNGTLRFDTVNNVNVASSLGKGDSISLGNASTTGILLYDGTGSSSNRTLSLAGETGGGTIMANGTGALQFTNTGAITVAEGSKTLTLGGNNTDDNLIAGVLGDGSSGIVSLTQTGTGTWVLTGENTYSGATTIEGGILRINGSTGSGAVTVQSGGTLGGTGTIGGAITLAGGGAVSPGNSIGTLSGSSLTWNTDNSTAGMVFELDPDGSTSDRLVLSGAFSKGTGDTFIFDFQGTGAFGSYTLVEFGSTDFDIADFDAANLAEGLNGSFNFEGDTLVFGVIPEPSSLGLILGALGLFGLRRRTWRRTS